MKLKFRAWLKKRQEMNNEIDHISWLEDELYCIVLEMESLTWF